MLFDISGKDGARIRLASRSYGKGGALLVIENSEIISCHNCGESCLPADALHEIERNIARRRNFAHTKVVAVAQFSAAKQSHMLIAEA